MSTAVKTLVVEDDADIRELLRWHLRREGFLPVFAADGVEGLEAFSRERPDVVLLDLMLPGIDGWRVCRQMRAMEGQARARIIILSARTAEEDVLRGLGHGADDYVRKPFRPKEVVARIRAVLRRRPTAMATPSDDIVERAPLVLDHAQREVRLNGAALALTATEYNLLRILMVHVGRVFTREQLLAQLSPHAAGAAGAGRSIDVHVRMLRRKLDAHADVIETRRGVGYRFLPPAIAAAEQGAAAG